MTQVKSVDLQGRIPDTGGVHFLRAEWKAHNPRFVLIRYAMGKEKEAQRYGLRLDLDKRVILDDVGDADTTAQVKARARDIWAIVAMRARQTG